MTLQTAHEDAGNTFTDRPVGSAQETCPLAQNCPPLLIVDELGEPYVNTQITLNLSNGQTMTLVTDGDGKVFPGAAVGQAIAVSIDGCHEVADHDSSQTPSGQHFVQNGNGPSQ